MIKRIVFIFLLLCSCKEDKLSMNNATIIPKPVSLIIKDGFFNLNDKVEILYDSLFFSEASYVKSLFPFNYGKNKNTIHLKKNIDLANEEYLLKISNNKIIIEF